MLTLLAPPRGAGKSYVAVDLARRIVAGEPFPDGAAPPPTAASSTSILSRRRESSALRLSAWRFDARRLFIMHSPTYDPSIRVAPPGRDRLVEAVCTPPTGWPWSSS